MAAIQQEAHLRAGRRLQQRQLEGQENEGARSHSLEIEKE